MKIIVFVCFVAQFLLCSSKTLPDYLPEPCHKSDPDYKGCILKSLEKVGPYVLKGIPEFNVPKMDPLFLPLLIANRTLNEFVSISATIKNMKVTGLSTVYINDLKVDLDNMAGEIKLTMPKSFCSMEYDVTGKLFTVPLESEGFFKGNFSDISIHFKGSLKLVEKEGVKYFAIDKFKFKSRIGGAYIKMIAKDPRAQFAADLITNFFNENPRRVLDAINPYYIDGATDFYRALFEQALAAIPAAELLPE